MLMPKNRRRPIVTKDIVGAIRHKSVATAWAKCIRWAQRVALFVLQQQRVHKHGPKDTRVLKPDLCLGRAVLLDADVQVGGQLERAA